MSRVSIVRTLIVASTVGFVIVNASAASAAVTGVPENLTIGGMFLQADWIVKLVMIGLMIASLLTWTVFVAKVAELRKATTVQREVHDQLIGLRSLGDAERSSAVSASPLVREARMEIELSGDALSDAEGVKERVVSRLERLEAADARRMTRGVNILATIGSTAPFVGLFGTVWGIMNSFIGIAEKQTSNLAVVAPGIAEALLATAFGLVAAIPSVVIYNHFSRQISAHRALVADTSAAILRLVSRDLSRGTVPFGKA